jgi:hypothetical protein
MLVRKKSEKNYQTVFFDLQSNGRLTTSYGYYLAATFTAEVTQVQALGPEDEVLLTRISATELRCDVGAGNILQCAACNNAFSRTVFRTQSPAGGFVQDILRIDAQPTRDEYYTLQFGIFTGADCV